jgi:hypothetical protein
MAAMVAALRGPRLVLQDFLPGAVAAPLAFWAGIPSTAEAGEAVVPQPIQKKPEAHRPMAAVVAVVVPTQAPERLVAYLNMVAMAALEILAP